MFLSSTPSGPTIAHLALHPPEQVDRCLAWQVVTLRVELEKVVQRPKNLPEQVVGLSGTWGDPIACDAPRVQRHA